MLKTHILGYPRIGLKREIKKATERYWKGKISLAELVEAGRQQRQYNRQVQREAGIDILPSNDFSFYDQVLDMALTVGAIPPRYDFMREGEPLDLYFAMARGSQEAGRDVTAMEMTKWFNTNYHYIVPEFTRNQSFELFSHKCIEEFEEAKSEGVTTKPVLIGPVSFLLLGKEKEEGFHRIQLLERLLPVYQELLENFRKAGAEWIQLEEPLLAMDLDEDERQAFPRAYEALRQSAGSLKLMLTTYFDALRENGETARQLPIDALHIDLVSAPKQLDQVVDGLPSGMALSLGIVDGRNIWKNDYDTSLLLIEQAREKLGNDRVMIAPSCSLLHTPYDLDAEENEQALPPVIKNWMAFAKQKLGEVVELAGLADPESHDRYEKALVNNREAMKAQRTSDIVHQQAIKDRVLGIDQNMIDRDSPFAERQPKQHDRLQLPLFPTTTIGSFPQTKEIRKLRADFKKGRINEAEYNSQLEEHTKSTILKQEDIGLDVLVHGEHERNDMVEYFGELLEGFAFTQNGWVQSFGSRCVKPPIIYGDVSRPAPMTVDWTQYAQKLTDKPVKGMLTGPVTILQWSFARTDQPRKDTAMQIALAIRDEVLDLEKAGISAIQIDEPAMREGLPLRRDNWPEYLDWAVRAFRVASSGVQDDTQIHTHMCYSEFNDIIEHIAAMDADVITIETSRSQMELLNAFADFKYPNEIGPGVYDIHSPRVPTDGEMRELLEKAVEVIPARNLWVNPDCGLKTRGWEETEAALRNMVNVARWMRKEMTVGV